MKFEFVDFYPLKSKRHKNVVGTVHIYAIDCELDIRGIIVQVNGKAMFFSLPHYRAIDNETGEEVRYPHIRWTNEATHKEMMDFLHQNVKPEIKKRLK
jgi:hypothetical protein